MKVCEDVESEKRSGNEIVSKLCFNNRFVNNVSLSRKARERRGGGHYQLKTRSGVFPKHFNLLTHSEVPSSVHVINPEKEIVWAQN